MAKPLTPPPRLSVFALAYILVSVQLPLNLTDGLSLVLSVLLFAPVLAAWLGWRFGRAALGPLILSAPVTVPDWYFGIGSGFSLQLGLGLALFALCAVMTLVFAARRDGQEGAAAPGWPPGALAIAAGILVLAAGYADAGASAAYSRVSVGADAPWSIAVAVFGLIALRRCPAAFAGVAVTVIAAAGYALNQFGDVFIEARNDGYTYAFNAAAAWGMRAPQAFSLGLAAIFAGLIVRNWPGLAAATGLRRLAVAGLAVLLLLPPALVITETRVKAALAAAPATQATLVVPGAAVAAASLFAGPLALQAVEEIVVTASPRRGPSAQTALGHTAAGFLLALFSLVLGAGLSGRGAFLMPQGVVLAVVMTALGVEWTYHGPGYFADLYFAQDFIRENLSVLIWAAFTCWTFVWLGMQVRLRADNQTGGGPWTGM